MRAREVFLALLIIGAGVFLTYEKSGRLDGWFEGWDGPWFGDLDEFVYEETREIRRPRPGRAPGDQRPRDDRGRRGRRPTRRRSSSRSAFPPGTKPDADRIADDLRMIVARSDVRSRPVHEPGRVPAEAVSPPISRSSSRPGRPSI